MRIQTVGRLGLLSSLYFSQGLPFGFFTQALPAVLFKLGLSLPAIGAASFLALPWMLKFLWAPLVDRAPSGALGLGRRRAWLLPLQASAIVTIAVMARLSPDSALPMVLAATLLCNLIAATQDIAADGLAVELLDPDERGHGNGVQVAAYRVGMIVGGGALIIVYDQLGWTYCLLSMSALLALASLPIALWREPPRAVQPQGGALVALWAALRRPGMAPWLGLLIVYKFGEALGSGIIRPYLLSAGLDMTALGVMVGTGGFTAGLVGAVIGGWLAGRLGSLRAAAVGGFAQSLAVACWAIPAFFGPKPALLWLAALAEPLLSGIATVSVFTAMMAACRREEGQAGTDYTLQASAFVLSTIVGGGLSGLSAKALGFGPHFALAALLSLGGAALLMARSEGLLRRLTD